MILLLDLEMGIIEAWISLLDPGVSNQIGINFGTRGAKRLGGGSLSSIGLDDISEVFVAQSVVVEGLVDRLKDLGFTVEVDQFHDLFDLMGQMKFGFGQKFQIVVGRLAQGEERIPVLKISGPGS